MTSPQAQHGRSSRWAVVVAIAVVAAAVVAVGTWLAAGKDDELARALVRRGRTLVVSPGPIGELPPLSGTTWLSLEACPGAQSALSGEAPAAVAQALRGCDAESLLMLGESAPKWAAEGSVAQRLRAYASTDALVGRYLSSSFVLYGPDPIAAIPRAHQQALAVVARRLLQGERPPRLGSFPAQLRAVAHVEVMVLLRRGLRPRLWRSARGTSIARAFLTAVRVARQRWDERSAAMGGPLGEALPGLTVSISLLQDDGELGTRSDGFVDEVVSAEHGVAYDRKGSWRYLLPAATTEQGDGRPSVALRQLFADNALGSGALGRSEVRPYRLRVRELGVSLPTRRGADPLGRVEDPDELLAPRLPRD